VSSKIPEPRHRAGFLHWRPMNPEAQSILDSLEADIDRQRNLAPELKVSMLAKLDALRAMMK
jgi:ABC-type sugar transport system ATPase subunit